MLAVKFNEVPDEALPVGAYSLSLPVLPCSCLLPLLACLAVHLPVLSSCKEIDGQRGDRWIERRWEADSCEGRYSLLPIVMRGA